MILPPIFGRINNNFGRGFGITGRVAGTIWEISEKSGRIPGSRGCHRGGPCSGSGGSGGGVGCSGGRWKTAHGMGWEGKRGGRLGAMGSLKHSIQT